MYHFIAILIATLLIICNSSSLENSDATNLDYQGIFSTDKTKFPDLSVNGNVDGPPEKCECHPRSECSINTDGYGLIDVRISCPNDDETCCPMDGIIKNSRNSIKKPACDCVARTNCSVNPDGDGLLGIRIDCPNTHEVCCPTDKIIKDQVVKSTKCLCVGRNYCEINTEGIKKLDFRMGCSQDNEVCCPRDKVNNTDLLTNEETPIDQMRCRCISSNNCLHKLDFRISDCPIANEVCCPFDAMRNQTIERVTKPPSPNLVGKKCGIRYTKGVNNRIGTRIQNDEDTEAELGEFPWVVGIYTTKTDPIFEYLCGGSLIHPKVVLTAAHCLRGGKRLAQLLFVRAGDHDQQTDLEIVKHQDQNVAEIIKHPRHYKAGNHNDIALLILEHPFELKSHINLICIPPSTKNFDNQKCFAAGWGKDKDGPDGKFKNLLQKVELPIVPNDICEKQLKDTQVLSEKFTVHESLICAGGVKDQDTCKGDGGTALVCSVASDSLHYYQAGIVSWGIGCGMENVPALYTNVPLFHDWIDEQLQLKGLDTSVYQFE